MKTNFLFYIILIFFFLFSSCNSNRENVATLDSGDGMAKMQMAEAPPAPEQTSAVEFDSQSPETVTAGVTDSRKIIRDGRMEIRVKQLEQGKRDIDSLVKEYKGYYADETFNNQDYAHGYSLKIRIPSAGFDAFISAIEAGEGEVSFKNITSRDVTEEFIDLETRLKNKQHYLDRYGDLLKQARSVKDILEIEEKTRLIEEEAESVQGRLKYLNNQVDYSTLDLQITRKNDYNLQSNQKGSFIDRLKLSLVKGWFGLVSFTLFVIRLWPFWIIVALLYYVVRMIIRKRRK